MANSSHHGHSSATHLKQADFCASMDLLCALWGKIFKKRIAEGFSKSRFSLDYTDLYAGGGTNPDTGEDGSPILALNSLLGFKHETGYDFTATFYEHNATTFNRLVQNLGPYDKARISVLNKDHKCVLETLTLKKWQYGLVYSDSNNGDIPVDVLAHFNQQRPVTDFLISVTANGRKRRGAPPLEDDLLATGKRLWYIREVVGKWQWTMLIGTNWPNFPKPSSARNFYPLNSEYGQMLLAKCGYSKKQMYGHTLPMFDDLPAPTPYSSYPEYLKQPRYRAIRKIAMERAGHICQRCGESRATEAHHLEYPPWWGTDTPEACYDVPENLLPVCHECHCEIEGKED